MKLLTYVAADGRERLGALGPGEDEIVDLSSEFDSMLALIEAGPEAVERARAALARTAARLPLNGVTLRSPLPVPKQLRDAMMFEKHYRQSIRAIAQLRVGKLPAMVADRLGLLRIPAVWYRQPTYYKCNRFSVIGHGQDVLWPRGAELMDFELELAVVIGKTGKDIPRERAMEHVFGYTIFNDMTARDLQNEEMKAHLGPAKGKDFDTGNVLGPWIVTPDELSDPYGLTMIARVNGEEWGRGSSADMHHRWDTLIAHVSRNETLHAGEVIGSGTVGNGSGLELGRWLAPGDQVELEVQGIGVLRNRLVKA